MTPIEIYDGIYVKRDDLCFDSPAPPFSKCRGVLKHLMKLKKSGINTVGYTETSISMAGWGVAWACKELGMKAVIFDPQYKSTPDVLAYHRSKWKEFNTIIEPIPAGMAKVNWYISRKILKEKYGENSELLPLGLPFQETVEATKIEVLSDAYKIMKTASIVSCIGSGTIFAGIWKGLNELNWNGNLYGIMTRTGNIQQKIEKVKSKAGIFNNGLFKSLTNIKVLDPGWEYTEKSEVISPFLCHAYYDLKAWEWLIKHRKKLIDPILFWNIGH